MRIHTTIVLALSTGIILFLLGEAPGDSDRRGPARATAAMLASPEYEAYAEECGSCHLAYPPGLLPARSWRAVMGGLDDHFGESAELDAETTRAIGDWLAGNAAEARTHRKSAKILKSVRGATPLRVSTTPYVLGKHDEIRASVFRRKSVASRANCAACHPSAERWDFDDDDVRIPRF
ncbi:MAG: cytochrome C [Kofleriaceae bacterium]|nr:MAG: cytochrome C [Kofleriaceae bacterium]MBZ0231894.1 diheme cytochrome c [Kofleriaceae bacterium]